MEIYTHSKDVEIVIRNAMSNDYCLPFGNVIFFFNKTMLRGTRFMWYDVRNKTISLYKLLRNSSCWIKM